MDGHVFPRVNKPYPTAVAGEGCWIIDSDGKRYLDGSGGAAVSCLGHTHPKVIEAIRSQVGKLEFAHTAFFTNEPAEALADILADQAPGDLSRVYIVSGGSEAVESALKLARQFHVENGEPSRYKIISRRQSYHGNTLGALNVGGQPQRKAIFEPMLPGVDQVSPCYAYREKLDGESDDDYGTRLAQELDDKIMELGPDTVAAFMAETVSGATLGTVPPVDGYFRKIRAVCDKHGVLLILDEVMCGMGRTGYLFACQEDGIVPDIVTCAKGLGGGYQSVGAMITTAKIYDTITAGSGAFKHGHTYLGHPVATAAALAVQTVIIEDDLLTRVRDKGQQFVAMLHDAFGNDPHIGDIRGRGFFQGLELVQDRATKEPFDAKHNLHAKIKAAGMDEGLICYPYNGSVDGQRGDHILLAPPFIISDDEMGELVGRLRAAVDTALNTVR